MKTMFVIIGRSLFILFVSLLEIQSMQLDTTYTFDTLGNGTIYLKENRIIRNIRIKEVKTFWIVYEKEATLHDKTMDEIVCIDFESAKPLPVRMTFEKNKPVLKHLPVN